MRSTIAAALSVIALMVSPAATQTSFDAAGTSCAQFLKARAGDALHRLATNWLYGYASGLNAGLKAASQAPVPRLTNDQLLQSASDYCQANPGATIANAASSWVPQPPPAAAAPVPPPSRGFFMDLNTMPTQPGGRR